MKQELHEWNVKKLCSPNLLLGYDRSGKTVGAIMFKHVCMILLASSTFFVWPAWNYLETCSLISSASAMGIEVLSSAIVLSLYVRSMPSGGPKLCLADERAHRRSRK